MTGQIEGQKDQVPVLSVVMATYNRVDTLRRTMDNLVKQDIDPDRFEVIVIDDKSPDNTAEMMAELAPSLPFSFTYLQNEENRGPGYTQNRGIRQAKGRLVLLIADDIWLTPGALGAHIAFHEAHPDDNFAALGTVLQSPELDQSVFLKLWDPLRFVEFYNEPELPCYKFGACNVSLKKEFLMANGLFLEHRGRGGAAAHEDMELGHRLGTHGLRLFNLRDGWGHHHHYSTLDQAVARWHERGMNFDEFRKHVPDPELTVHFHVLNMDTIGEYYKVLAGPNSFQGREASFAWHVVRHLIFSCVLNRLTAKLIWRPILDLAETTPWLAARLNRHVYRAFLYFHFLRGIAEARQRFGRGLVTDGADSN